jgi:phage terminase large subunit
VIDEQGFRVLNHNFEHWFEPVDEHRRPDPDGDFFYFRSDIRYFFSHGGRGGGKSEFVAEILDILGSQFKIKILCAREFQNSIDESVLSILKRKIEEMEESGELPVGFYTIKNNKIYGQNGTLVTFVGLARHIGSIKSMDDYDILWIEEGQYISAVAWGLLDPTIRKAGSVVIITMNRDSEDSCLDRQFIQEDPPENAIVTRVNYYDNPYDIPVLRQMAEECKRKNPDAYQHIWEGELNNISEAQILSGKWRIANFITPEGVAFYHGGDWSNGGADPHTVIRSFVVNNKLYIDYEVKTNVDDTKLPLMWEKIPTLSDRAQWKVWCDNSRPDIIRKMGEAGYNVEGAAKIFKGITKKDAVKMAGVSYLRDFEEIVIHERCVETIKEAKNWKWKIDDKSGDIMPEFTKGNDHLMDALRYSHWKMILAYKMAQAKGF